MENQEIKKQNKVQIYTFDSPGDYIGGKLTGFQKVQLKNGREAEAAVIERSDDRIFLVLLTTVLSSRLKNLALPSQVEIQFMGYKRSQATGRTYKDFSIWAI